MVSRSALGLGIVLTLYSLSSAHAEEDWIGRVVFFNPDAKARNGNKRVDHQQIPFPSTVEQVQGEWLLLGPAWIRKRDVMGAHEALDFYTERIKARPFDVRSHTALGMVLNTLGRYEESVLSHTEAIKLHPRYHLPYYNRALVRIKAHQYAEAQRDFLEFLRRDPRNAAGHRAYARFLVLCPAEDLRDADESVRHATKACELTDWKQPLYLDALAGAYSEAGNFEKAIETQNKAIDLMPAYENDDYLVGMQRTLDHFKEGRPYRLAIPQDFLNDEGY